MAALLSALRSPYVKETRVGKGVVVYKKDDSTKCYWFPQSFKGPNHINKELVAKTEEQGISILVNKTSSNAHLNKDSFTLYAVAVLPSHIAWKAGSLVEVEDLPSSSDKCVSNALLDYLWRANDYTHVSFIQTVREYLNKNADELTIINFCKHQFRHSPSRFLVLYQKLIPLIEERNNQESLVHSPSYIELKDLYEVLVKLKDKISRSTSLVEIESWILQLGYSPKITSDFTRSVILMMIDKIDKTEDLLSFNDLATFLLVEPRHPCEKDVKTKFHELRDSVYRKPALNDCTLYFDGAPYKKNSVMLKVQHPLVYAEYVKSQELNKKFELLSYLNFERGTQIAIKRFCGVDERINGDFRTLFYYRCAADFLQLKDEESPYSKSALNISADEQCVYKAFFENNIEDTLAQIEKSASPKQTSYNVIKTLLMRMAFNSDHEISKVHDLILYARTAFSFSFYLPLSPFSSIQHEKLCFKLHHVEGVLMNCTASQRACFYDLLTTGSFSFIREEGYQKILDLITPITLPLLLQVSYDLSEETFARKFSGAFMQKLQEESVLPPAERKLFPVFEKYAHLLKVVNWPATSNTTDSTFRYVIRRAMNMTHLYYHPTLTLEILRDISEIFPEGMEELNIMTNCPYFGSETVMSEELKELAQYLPKIKNVTVASNTSPRHYNISRLKHIVWLTNL